MTSDRNIPPPPPDSLRHRPQATVRLPPSGPTPAEFEPSLLHLLVFEGQDELEQVARRTLSLRPDNWHAQHTAACILARRGHWEEAAATALRFLSGASNLSIEDHFADVLSFCSEAVRSSHATETATLLRKAGLSEKWQPLHEALLAAGEGSDVRLRLLAPEVRAPAEEILRGMGERDEAVFRQ